MKSYFCIFVLLLICADLFAEDTAKDWSLTPLLNYEYLSFDGQGVHSPGVGLMFTKGNMNPSVSEERNSLLIAGVYKQYFIQDTEDGYPNIYYSINLMIDRKINRHLIFGLFVAESDKPLYGGLRTFIGGPAYGYEFIRSENISLTLGVGLGVGDFGIELPNGESLPVMPIPVVRFNLETSWINLAFEFLRKPVLNATLFPKYRIRLINTFGVLQIRFRDIRDLLFDTMLMYRFFSKDSKLGDFAGIGIGFKNGGFGFPLAEKDKSYEFIYYSIYGLIDLSFLKIQGGYSFNGLEIYDSEKRKNIGDGFFINVILAWQF